MGEVTDPNILAQLNGGVQVQPQRGGGIIVTDPTVASKEARAQAGEQRATAQNTFRTMTSEEVAAQGLPVDGVYQINGLGEIKTIKPPKTTPTGMEAAKQGAQLLLQSAGVVGGRDPVADLIRGSTSGRLQAMGAEAMGAVTGESTSGMENIAKLKSLTSDMVLSLTGGSLGAGVSNADVAFLKERVGNLGDPNIPANERLAAWEEVKSRLQRFAGEQPTSAPSTGGMPATPVTEEQSAALFGQARFDANGNPVGADYQGETFFADGTPGPFMGRITGGVPDPRDNMGLIEGAVETFTGSERSTPEIEALPDWTEMPLPIGLMEQFQTGLATMMSSPDETARIMASMVPGLTVRQDAKGNYILRNPSDGKEYAIKPGFRGSDVPRAIGSVLAFTPAGRATTFSGSVAANAGTQAAMEAAQAASGGSFDATDIVAAGGTAGALNLAGRGVRAVRSGTPSGGGSRVVRDASEIAATGQAENVPVMTSDIRPPRTWIGGWLQSTGEKLPIVGTGGKRAAQQEARVAMIERLADDYAATPASIDDVTTDFMKTRGGEIAKFTQQKREVFSSLAGAPPPAPQASLDALDMAIGRYGQQETYRPLVARIQGWRNDLANARSIDDIEDLRKAIGDTFNDESMKSSSTALRNIVNGPDGLYSAIKKDMAGYIRDNAGEQRLAKWSAANAKLADFADDLEKNTLNRVLRNGEATPEEAASLLFSKKPSDVAALFKNLSPEGQKRARAVVVQKLIDDAGGIAEVSTAKFRSALVRAKDTIGVIFPKDEAGRLTGMMRLLQATRRAEQASVTTPTGQSTLPFVGASGLGFLAGDWFGAAGVGAATAAGFRIYESKAMRNLLTALSKTQPGSKAESNILRNIAQVTSKAAATTGATTQTRPETEKPAIEVRQ